MKAADRAIAEQFMRENTLVELTFTDGGNLVDMGRISASPCVCFLSGVTHEGCFVRLDGSLWLFRWSDKPAEDPGFCPVIESLTSAEVEP